MAQAPVNDTTLYYTEEGQGPPCLVMHGGLGLDHTLYKATLDPLTEALRLVYYDHRGNGRSARPPLETITIPQLAEDADALREHLGLEKIAVMGHSYGGFVALEYATRYPERLTHLVLLDTSAGVFEPTPAELAERPDPSWITARVQAALDFIAGPLPDDDDGFAAVLPDIVPIYTRTVDPEVILEVTKEMIIDRPAMIRGYEVLEGWSVVDRLDRIACPTLVVCGRYDLLTTPECAKRLSTAIPGAEIAWFENSGHFPWLEEPDAFFAAVTGWVSRVS